MRQIVLLYGVALGTELVQDRLHIHRIPDNDRVRDEIETHRLISLGFFLLAANHPFVSHEEKISERMEGFPFVELGIDPSTVIGVFQVAEDKERLNKPTVCPSNDSASMLSYQELPTSIQWWRGHSQEAKIG
jgi:hypothetical protein